MTGGRIHAEIYTRFSDAAKFDPEEVFDPRPTTLVMVATLEITVRDDFGTYLLVISPRYDEVEVADPALRTPLPESARWAVPYISRTLDRPSGGYRTIQATLDEVKKQLNTWKPKPKLKIYGDALFRGISDLEPVEGFYELKQSWSQPQVTKLYRILRYRGQVNCDNSMLADPDSRKGIAFIPIDQRYEAVTRTRYCEIHRRTERLYRSTPIEANVCAVIEDDEQRRDLKRQAVQLKRDVFFREYAGLLFCGDIAGYGAATSYAEGYMRDFSKQDYGAVLRDSAAVAFTDLFLAAGVTQVHTAGDGFICAMPLAAWPADISSGAVRNALDQFATAYIEYIESLDVLNDQLKRHAAANATGKAPVLGSRLAIHYGQYRYGKMSQAASLLTGFDGREIVAVSRFEQGLRAVSKTPALARRHRIHDLAHVAAASKEAMSAWGGKRGLPPCLAPLGTFKAVSKEFKGAATLLQLERPHET